MASTMASPSASPSACGCGSFRTTPARRLRSFRSTTPFFRVARWRPGSASTGGELISVAGPHASHGCRPRSRPSPAARALLRRLPASAFRVYARRNWEVLPLLFITRTTRKKSKPPWSSCAGMILTPLRYAFPKCGFYNLCTTAESTSDLHS